MNILIIDNSVAFTGAFKCALNEAEMLRPNRFIFVLNKKSTLEPLLTAKGFTVYTLPMVEIRRSPVALLRYPISLLLNTLRLKRILKEEAVNVIQVNDFYNLLGAMSRRFGFEGKLFTYVRFLPSAIPASLKNIWLNQAQKHSDRIVAVSDAVMEQLPANEKNIRIYDAVKLEERLPAKNIALADKVQLLYLANYIRGKGNDHAIDAFALAYKQNKQLRLKLAGGDMGLPKNKLYKEELKNKVVELGLENVVEFATFSDNVEAEIKQADIVLNFSEAESFSMTCLEAAFYGTPLIATRCGGPEEIIADNKTGVLVANKDINEMANAILKLAANTELRNYYALAGKKYVRDKFSTEQFARAFEKILRE